MTSIDRPIGEELPVGRWTDPVVEGVGYRVHSDYCEWFWLPILGPSALWAIRRLDLVADQPGTIVPIGEFGRSMGLGNGKSSNAPIARTLHRLVRFGAASWLGDQYLVRSKLAPLPAHLLRRLPPALQVCHERWVRPHAS